MGDQTPWVAGHLTGGLGNRLFQHAAAAGYAEKHKYRLVFSLPHCGNKEHGEINNIFKLYPDVPLLRNEEPAKMVREAANGAYTYTPFEENPDGITNLCVDGWRQTDKYFPSGGMDGKLEEAIAESRQREILEKYNLSSDIQKCNSYFIHVRLGDYKILPHHQINIDSYYQKAIRHIPDNANILVLSDDLNEYGGTLLRYFRTYGREVILVDLEDELEAMYLMSQCWGGGIVGNSTFSWWGAYFGRQRTPNKESYVACYPKNWGSGMPPTTDLIPSWGISVPNVA